MSLPESCLPAQQSLPCPYRVKVWEFPDGREVSAVALRGDEEQWAERRWRLTSEEKAARRAKRGQSERRLENQCDAVRRAKTGVRRKVRAAGLDRLLTLTTRENVTDRERFLRAWDQFCRAVRKALGPFPFVAVLERQKRGALHLHAAIAGFYHVNVLRGIWQSIWGGKGSASVNISHRPGWTSARIARYLAKYIAKTFDEAAYLNKRRYFTSHKIDVRPALSYYVASDDFSSVGELLRDLRPMVEGLPAEAEWISDGEGVLWLTG